MATSDSAKFGVLSGEATRGAAAGGAPAGRPRHGLADVSTDLQAPASDPPPAYRALPPHEHTGDRQVGPDEDDETAVPPAATSSADAFAEFEASAMAGESTRIEESEILADQSTAIIDEGPALPFLFVEAGKDRGREYVLQEGETSIGRGIDNDVILADVSVSRRHVRVHRDGSTLTLRDLGSGNGSLVNGRKAHVQQLSEGDRIEIGETILVVRTPGSVDDPMSQATAATGATAETASPVSGDIPMGAPSPFATPGSYPQPTYPPSSTDSMPLPGRDGPTRSVVLPRRLAFISAAAVAVLASMIGAGVATFLGRDDSVALPLPETAATGVPAPLGGASVPSTPPAGAAGPAAPQRSGAASAAPTVAPAAGLPGAPTAGLPPAAIAPVVAPPPLAPPVVAAVAPVEPRAAAVADDAPDEAPEVRGGSRGAGSAARTTAPTRGSGGRDAALASYRSANFAEAARLARAAAGSGSATERRTLDQLANDIESFADLYPRIRDVGDNFASIERIAGPALRLDRSISGGHFTNSLRTRYVSWLVSQGESGFSADPVAACGRAMSASGLDASNARVRALIGRCETRAADMLAEATRVERSDPSRAQGLYRQIARMLPASHATARDAARRLAGVGRARPVDEDE